MVDILSHGAVLLIILYITSQVYGDDCSAKPSRGFNFSIISKKNITGHWTSLVHLKHGGALVDNGSEEGSWHLDVSQTSQKCSKGQTVDIEVSITAPPAMAGPDYELVPGLGYYKHHTTPTTWTTARQTCYEEGAHLAIINSENERNVLQGLFTLHPKIQDGWQNDFAHIGIHDLFVEGHFVTIFGEPLESTGFSKFAEGRPNAGRSGNCGAIHRTKDLYDSNCGNILSFFCEQELI